MPAELLDAIKQQVLILTMQERSQLAAFLQEQQRLDARQQPVNGQTELKEVDEKEQARRRRANWFHEHGAEYAGLYVALDGERLLGTGKTYPEAVAVARRMGLPEAFIDYVYPPNYEGRVGGW